MTDKLGQRSQLYVALQTYGQQSLVQGHGCVEALRREVALYNCGMCGKAPTASTERGQAHFGAAIAIFAGFNK